MKNDELSVATKLACVLTMADQEILKECPQSDRITVHFTCLGLILQFWFSFALMAYALTIVIPEQHTLLTYGLALLIAAIIYCFEVRMISSDWTISGILRNRQAIIPLSQMGRLAVRMGFSLIFAIGLYAVPLELKLQEGPIFKQIMSNQMLANKPIFEKLNLQENELHKDSQALQAQVNKLKEQKKVLNDKKSELSAQISDFDQKRRDQEYESFVQKNGLHKREKGTGPLFEEAEFLKSQFTEQKNYLTDEQSKLNKSIEEIAKNIKSVEEAVTQKNSELNEFRKKKDDFAKRKIGYVQFRDDLLARYVALDELSKDPNIGNAVKTFGYGIRIVLISIELLPLLVKVFFSPASIYHLKLCERTILEAAKTRYATEDALLKMRGINHAEKLLILSDRTNEDQTRN